MNPELPRPLIIGHRGASDVAPENTRPAIDMAISAGCDGIEIDVQMTRDHIPVLYHDRTLHRINGRWTRISTQDFERLLKLDWGKWFSVEYEGEKLLSLTDVLQDYASRTRLFIEVKSHTPERRSGHTMRLTEIVMELVGDLVPEPFRHHVALLSFDIEVLRHAHRLGSKGSYVWNLEKTEFTTLPEFLSAICVPIKNLTSRLVQEVHGMDKQVMTYTCNTARQADFAISTGADVLMTDRPAWLVQYLKKSKEF